MGILNENCPGQVGTRQVLETWQLSANAEKLLWSMGFLRHRNTGRGMWPVPCLDAGPTSGRPPEPEPLNCLLMCSAYCIFTETCNLCTVHTIVLCSVEAEGFNPCTQKYQLDVLISGFGYFTSVLTFHLGTVFFRVVSSCLLSSFFCFRINTIFGYDSQVTFKSGKYYQDLSI